jgi:hypothetical protein
MEMHRGDEEESNRFPDILCEDQAVNFLGALFDSYHLAPGIL